MRLINNLLEINLRNYIICNELSDHAVSIDFKLEGKL